VYELVPGFEGEVWGASVKINSHGIRDREYDVRKPAGTYRIAAIGDSITFGNRLAQELTYSERLEGLFVDRAVEVLNLGVGGYDTLQEVARLEQVGLQFDPDHVVVGYCVNDAGVASVNRKYVERLAGYDSVIYELRVVQLLAVSRDRLEEAGHAEDALDDDLFERENREKIVDVREDAEVVERIERLRKTIEPPVDSRKHRFLPWYVSEARIGKLRFSFERLAELAAAGGFGVTVAIVPHLNEERHAAAYAIVYESIRYEAERVGFGVVDLYDPFSAEGFEGVRTNRIHPDERGHEIIAERIHAHLIHAEPRLRASRASR
jgi:lysophospholipase L1-like esterase